MAFNSYKSQLDQLLTNPGSFSGTPGYQFARDQGLQATQRGMSSQRNSGNVLAALLDRGTGMAQQDYGNQVNTLGKLSGQQDQYNLGEQQNTNTAQNNAWNYSLGQGQNQNTANRNANDFSLGNRQADNVSQNNAWNFGLGQQQNANTAQNNWWQYDVNKQQNANTAANNQNNFMLGQGRNAIDWFGANTNRGTAESNSWLNGQRNKLDWTKYYNPTGA